MDRTRPNSAQRCAHGVAFRHILKLSCEWWEPDEAACPQCAVECEAQREARDAESEAFLQRLAARNRGGQ